MLLLTSCGDAKRFMETTSGRRKLAATAPDIPENQFCEQPPYLTYEPTQDVSKASDMLYGASACNTVLDCLKGIACGMADRRARCSRPRGPHC